MTTATSSSMATTATTTTTSQTTANLDTALTDPWTPDQELTLLKALVQFKPVGLHAHFRMVSIHQFLHNSGTCNEADEHTRIPGIWAKLRTLYALDRLNEREDAGVGSTAADEDMEAYWRDFELPRDDGAGRDFERLMWERRLAPEGTPESPEWSTAAAAATSSGGGGGGGGRGGGRRESTVAGTDEPRSSPVASSVVRGARGGRRGGRVSRLKGEAETIEGGRRSRRDSRTASEVDTKDEDGDENMEDADDDDEGGSNDSDEEEEDSETPDEDEEQKRNRVVKRGRGGGRRGGRGRRGRPRRG